MSGIPNAILPKSKKNTLRRLVFAATVLLVVYTASQFGLDLDGNHPEPAPPGYFRVISIADGDTFSVSMNGVEERVRLVGVDTPETHHPDKGEQCYGQEASDYTKKLLNNDIVRLEADTKQPNRDRYSRLLRYAYLEDGRELNELLVREGYAFATNFNTSKKQLLRDLQNTAKSTQKGLWEKCSISSKNGRLQTNQVH